MMFSGGIERDCGMKWVLNSQTVVSIGVDCALIERRSKEEGKFLFYHILKFNNRNANKIINQAI